MNIRTVLNNLSFCVYAGLFVLLAPVYSASAQSDSGAQDILEEIIVTARGRNESLQEVPVTVSAFTAQQILDAGIERPGDFIALTPNVTMVEAQNAGTSFITIRGISQVRNNEAPVAIAVDGMLQTNPNQFTQQLLDIERIEVLKGPQGALYGRNAVGGAINITTKQPGNKFEGRLKAGYGNGDHKTISGSVSGPVVEDTLFYRISGLWLDRDGYIDNVVLGEEVDPIEDTAVQGRFTWKATDNLSANLRLYYSDLEGGALNYITQIGDYGTGGFNFAGTIDSDDTSIPYQANNIGENTREIFEAALKLDYGTDYGTLTSITSYNQLEESYFNDQFPYSRFNSLTSATGGIGLDGSASQYWDVDAWSQEFRFTSPNENRLRWIAGVYYVQTDRFLSTTTGRDLGQGLVHVKRTPLGVVPAAPLNFCSLVGAASNPTCTFLADDNDNSAWAVFGQVNYDITEQLEASFALRYDEDKREQTVSPFNRDLNPTTFQLELVTPGLVRERTFDNLQPKFVVKYSPTDNLTLFASYGQGFRSGQFNQSGVVAQAAAAGLTTGVNESAEQEESETFEFSIKSAWFDNRMKLSAAIFNTDVSDQHYFLFFATGSGQAIINIDEVDLLGVEVDMTARVADGLDIYAAYGYTDSDIKAYTANPEFIGNKAPYAPKFTINAGFQYRRPLFENIGWFTRLDFERRGKQFWDPNNSSARSSLNLLNLRGGLEALDGKWALTAWARNATDKSYNSEFVLGGIVHRAPPVSYGVEITYNF